MAAEAETELDAARHLLPLIDQALEAHRAGDAQRAERLSLDVLELAPTQTPALRVLYDLRKAAGRQAQAEILLRRLLAIDPNDFAATAELALLSLRKGDLADAERHGRNAVRIAPESPVSHNLLAMTLTELHRPVAGQHHYHRVLELSCQRDPIVLANLAWNYKIQGRIAEARALYQESAAAAPEVLQTLLGWARLEEVDRDFPAAAELLDRAEQLAPGDASIALARAVLMGRMQRHADALAQIGAARGHAPGRELGPDELLEQGRLLDRLGRFDEAWTSFEQSKLRAVEMTGNSYMEAGAAELARRLGSFFVRRRLRTLPKAAPRSDVPQPLFILGFPRSGTTLVEQTLTAHPQISAGDELPIISEIANLLPRMLDSPMAYPEALAELWMGDRLQGLDQLRDYYLQRAQQFGVMQPGRPWFTDKMPLNEMHLGLIGLIFPQAPLIHVIRHPLDAVISVFSNRLSHGFHCASSLRSAATHYAVVMDLVDHYLAEMNLRYLAIRYEDIVGDQDSAVRRMLAHVGVAFDPGCLKFHENRRYARTASYAQVTESLYDRSVFRYRNYRSQVAPVVPILQPVIERLGYRLD